MLYKDRKFSFSFSLLLHYNQDESLTQQEFNK